MIGGWLLAAAGLMFAFGLFMGAGSVGDCGSPWFPAAESMSSQLDRGLGVTGGNFDADCQQQVGSRGSLGSALLGVSGLFVLGAVLVWNRERMTWAAREKTVEAAVELSP